MPSPDGRGTYQAEEISLADVIRFLLAWWWLIVGCGAAGVAGAWFHLKDEPPTFEAQTIIAMAKVPIGNASATRFFLDVETPALLAERMSLPTTFSPTAAQTCGLASPLELMARLRIISRNDTTSTLRLAIRHSTPDLAERCVNAVVDMIREQQAALAKPVVAHLEKTLRGMNYATETGPSTSSKRGVEVSDTGLAVLQLRLALGVDMGTRMIAPIHAPAEPVSVPRRQGLSSWGAAGVFVGLVLALLWTLVVRFRRFPA